MNGWHFVDFVSGDGSNPIRDWLRGLDYQARTHINSFIGWLEPMEYLRRPYVGKLKGEFEQLLELRISFKKVEYRPLACYGPVRRDVVLLAGAIEKGSRFEPRSAPITALARRQDLMRGIGRVVEHEIE